MLQVQHIKYSLANKNKSHYYINLIFTLDILRMPQDNIVIVLPSIHTIKTNYIMFCLLTELQLSSTPI